MNAPPQGEAAPLTVMWPLSQEWYGDRLDPAYLPKTGEQLQRFLSRAGLISDFWRLT